MTSFVNPGLLWGLAILAVPILIHLINLMRHRRVQWAAMEFLLISRRKNSAWIRLKELLLLALRVAIVAAVVLCCAAPFAEPMGSPVRRSQDASDHSLGRQLLDVRSLGEYQRLRRS